MAIFWKAYTCIACEDIHKKTSYKTSQKWKKNIQISNTLFDHGGHKSQDGLDGKEYCLHEGGYHVHGLVKWQKLVFTCCDKYCQLYHEMLMKYFEQKFNEMWTLI